MHSIQAGRRRDDQSTRDKWRLQGRVLYPGVPDPFVASAKERCVRIKSVHRDGKCTTGTGVIFETGLVISNWHLVEDPTIIGTTVNDHEASQVHFDYRYDLVALASTTRKLRRIKIQEKPIQQTQRVFYVGNPEDWNKTVAEGTVVKVTNTKIRSSNCPAVGFSGSGLYSKDTGELVGIIDSLEGTADNGCNFSVAVPAHIVREFLLEALARFKPKNKPSRDEVFKVVRDEQEFPHTKFDFD